MPNSYSRQTGFHIKPPGMSKQTQPTVTCQILTPHMLNLFREKHIYFCIFYDSHEFLELEMLMCEKQVELMMEFEKVLQLPWKQVPGANMGHIWGRQDPGGPHFGPRKFAVWVVIPCLTHSGWVTHIYLSKLNIIGSDNDLVPTRYQAIITGVWNNVEQKA